LEGVALRFQRFSRLLSLPGTANLGAELNAAMKEMPIQTSLARSRRATQACPTMYSRSYCASSRR
jgi:hypothetical protein